MAKKKSELSKSQFAHVDESGKGHFPVDTPARVRNALARLDQSPYGAAAKPKVLAAAKRFGIDVNKKAATKNAKKSKTLKKPKKD